MLRGLKEQLVASESEEAAELRDEIGFHQFIKVVNQKSRRDKPTLDSPYLTKHIARY